MSCIWTYCTFGFISNDTFFRVLCRCTRILPFECWSIGIRVRRKITCFFSFYSSFRCAHTHTGKYSTETCRCRRWRYLCFSLSLSGDNNALACTNRIHIFDGTWLHVRMWHRNDIIISNELKRTTQKRAIPRRVDVPMGISLSMKLTRKTHSNRLMTISHQKQKKKQNWEWEIRIETEKKKLLKDALITI